MLPFGNKRGGVGGMKDRIERIIDLINEGMTFSEAYEAELNENIQYELTKMRMEVYEKNKKIIVDN